MSFVVRVNKKATKSDSSSSDKTADDNKSGSEKKETPSPMKKIKEELEKMEKVLEKIPMLEDLSKTYKHKKCTIAAVLIGVALFALLIVYDIMASFLVDFLSYFYPAYQSVKSVEKGEKGEYKQWLSYWVILNLMNFTEHWKSWLFKLFPYYYLLKGLIVLWLMVPHIHGASWIFHTIMKVWIPVMDKIAKAIDKREEKKVSDAKEGSDAKADKPAPSDSGPKKVERVDSKMDEKLTKADSKKDIKLSKSISKKNFFKYAYVS